MAEFADDHGRISELAISDRKVDHTILRISIVLSIDEG